MAQLEDWKCPVCCDLLHKPCVNICGHVFCFWCFHRAMDPFKPSQCPMCRTKHSHMPKVCELLHVFLLKSFPKECAAREAEVKAEEEDEYGISSPDVPLPAGLAAALAAAAATSADSAVGDGPALPAPQLADFTCASPACGQLLHEPTILSCGHAVCGSTCLPVAAPAGAAAAGSKPPCPSCSKAVLPGAKVCGALEATLRDQLFPTQYAERARQAEALRAQRMAQAALAQAQAAAAPSEAPPSAAGTSAPPAPAAADGSATTAAAAAAAAAAGGAAGAGAGGSGAGGRQGGRPASKVAGLEQALEGIEDEQVILEKLTQEMRAAADTSYTWYQVGCDVCGEYPIVGRRYRCMDCPEATGYDTCGACHDAGGAEVGRFNQAHKAHHRLEKVEPQLDFSEAGARLGALGEEEGRLHGWVNCLEALHPELPIEQVLAMAFGNLVVAQSYSEFQQAASDLIGHGAASRGGEGNTAAAPPQSRLATAAMRITPAPAAPSGGEPGRPEEAQTQAGGGADDSDTEG